MIFTRDLLRRHYAIHAGEGSGLNSPSRPHHHLSRRVSKACKECAAAKVKCDDEKPCRRCRKRGIVCTPNGDGVLSLDSSYARVGGCSSISSPTLGTGPFPMSAETGPTPLMDGATPDLAWITTEPPLESIQALDTAEQLAPCLMPDTEPYLETSLADFLEADFEYGGGWDGLITRGRIRQAIEAYKTSLWYSVPGQMNSPPTGEQPEALLNEICSSAPCRFNQSQRDTLFGTLIICAHNQSPDCLQTLCSKFPPPALLNMLVHSFLTKHDKKVDSWIHSASFEPSTRNMELSAIIVAASALNTSSPVLHQLGTTLRRLLRSRILEKVRMPLRATLFAITNRRSDRKTRSQL